MQVNINGTSINVPSGSNVSIINGKIMVNEKEYFSLDSCSDKTINITIDGSVGTLKVDNAQNVTVQNVEKDVAVDNGTVNIQGNVNGNVKVDTGTVKAGTIKGNVKVDTGTIQHN